MKGILFVIGPPVFVLWALSWLLGWFEAAALFLFLFIAALLVWWLIWSIGRIDL